MNVVIGLIYLFFFFGFGEGKTHNGDLCIGPSDMYSNCPNGEWTGKKTNLNEFKDITKITGRLKIEVSSPNRYSFFFF